MISNYIKNLIEVHSRVIVPDLGAFMLKGDASKTIYFNEFLRFNDGLLVDYVAEQEKIDKIDAAKKIKAFVDNANKLLLNNKSVELDGIGTLYLDVNEKIQLKTTESAASQTKPEEPVTETSPREILFELETTEPTVNQAKIIESEPVSSPKPPETPTSKAKAEPAAETSNRQSKAIQPPSKQKEVPVSIAKETKVQQSSSSNVKDDEVIDIVPTTTRRMVIVGIVGILVVGVIVYLAFFRSSGKYSSVNQNITIGTDSTSGQKDTSAKTKQAEIASNKQTKTKKAEKTHNESTKTEHRIATEDKGQVTTITPKVETHKNNVKRSGKRFYIVAGTFSIESNADKMFKKLKDQGFQPDKIRNDIKNVYYVSFSSFPDKASATEEMKKLKSSGTDAWIYAD